MHRYFFELEYNGKNYFGWQRQNAQISVQEVIEECLTKLHSNKQIQVIGCGRTDAGVHAKHFVLHTDLPAEIDEASLLSKLNKMLPDSIAIQSIYRVSHDKHARFHATARTYRYYIHKSKSVFLADRSLLIKHDLDIKSMNEAAEVMLGELDFTSLSKLNTDVKTNICTVTLAQWKADNEQQFYFEITANRFLRNMVRATVGTLLDVGVGKLSKEDFKQILAAKDRQKASVSAPAQGLFLWKVEY